MSNPVQFNCTVIRDGHQSLAATRMSTEQILPTLELLDTAGFGCLETWGGATIDSGLRFLHEFPFKRLDAIRAKTKTPHMMLLRGQNIVAYSHLSDDVVQAFVKKSIEHGMNIMRIFDALNDTRNMKCAIDATIAAGGHAQGTICYTKSPVHTTEKFIEMGVELEKMGCKSIVIKDMAGLIPPYIAAELVRGLKAHVKVPVWIHTHDTTGLGASTYLAAIDAGVDAIDVSIVPFANGTGQPDAMRMWSLLQGNPRQPKLDLVKLAKLAEMYEKIYKELGKFTSHNNEVVNNEALRYEVPGGMLSNFRTQLKDLKMEDKIDEVFAEIPVVREALGWIPLVTPTSQIVGTQAVMNVKFGRWKNFIPGAMDIALGYFGTTPAPVDPEVRKLAAEKSKKEPITCRPADLLKPAMEDLRKKLAEKKLPTDDEHCVIFAMFPQQLEELYHPAPKPAAPAPAPAAKAPAAAPSTGIFGKVSFTIGVNGEKHNVNVEEL
jgi:oxaloacetate decarboxylase alpha subunit/pyruvate carboxylase subunit B